MNSIDTIQLRPAQQKILDHLNTSSEDVCISLAPGGGKTILAASFMHQHQDHRFLVLTHTISLLNQFYGVLKDLGLDVHKYHGTSKDNETTSQIIVSTFQTLTRSLDNFTDTNTFTPTVIICDEAHKFSNNSAEYIFNAFPDTRKIGLTGTPAIANGSLSEIFGSLYMPMSQKELFDTGVLVTPIMIDATSLDDNTTKKLAKDKTKGDYLTSTLSAITKSNDVFNVLSSWEKHMAHRDKRKTLVFCSSIPHATRVNNDFLNAGYRSAILVSDPPEEELRSRTDIINKFRTGEIEILCSVSMLTEGFDVADTACAVLARPTRSLMIATQAFGRALRSCEGKEEAVILDLSGTFLTACYPTEDIDWDSAFRGTHPKTNPFATSDFWETPIALEHLLGGGMGSSSEVDETAEVLVGCCADHGNYKIEFRKDELGNEHMLPCPSCSMQKTLSYFSKTRERLQTQYNEFKESWEAYRNGLNGALSKLHPRDVDLVNMAYDLAPQASRPIAWGHTQRMLSLVEASKTPIATTYEGDGEPFNWGKYSLVLKVLDNIHRDQMETSKSCKKLIKLIREIREVDINLQFSIYEKVKERSKHTLKPEVVTALLGAKQLLDIWKNQEAIIKGD